MERSNETAACYLDTFENPTLLFKAESGCEEGERSLMRQGGDLDQDLRREGSGVQHPDTPLIRGG